MCFFDVISVPGSCHFSIPIYLRGTKAMFAFRSWPSVASFAIAQLTCEVSRLEACNDNEIEQSAGSGGELVMADGG